MIEETGVLGFCIIFVWHMVALKFEHRTSIEPVREARRPLCYGIGSSLSLLSFPIFSGQLWTCSGPAYGIYGILQGKRVVASQCSFNENIQNSNGGSIVGDGLMGPPLLLMLRTIMVCYLHLTHLIVNEIQMSLRLVLVSIIHMWLIR
ncbi:hypothetical protein YC2023_014707 [Brassica napus]